MTSRLRIEGRWMARILMAAALISLGACTAIYRNHGYMPPQEQLDALRVGVDTRESVAEAVGTPTAGGVLADGDYYYVRSRFRHYGFLAPVEVERRVLAVSFTDAGTLSNIELFGLEDGNIVVLERRVTDDNVRDTTFLRQLIGNIGNFDAGTLIGRE